MFSFIDPINLLNWLVGNGVPDVSHILPDLLPSHKLIELRPALVNWTLLDDREKAAIAQQVLGIGHPLLADDPRAGAGTDDTETDDDDSTLSTTSTVPVTLSSSTIQPSTSRLPATLGPVLG